MPKISYYRRQQYNDPTHNRFFLSTYHSMSVLMGISDLESSTLLETVSSLHWLILPEIKILSFG